MDQFRETSAPRKGIRDSNKRRLLALTCAPLPDQVETPPAAAGTGAAAALKVPGPLAAADLVAHLGLAKEVAAAATGGTGSAIAAAAARPHVAVWPQGAATNFRLLPGGAMSWWAMAHGRMVGLASGRPGEWLFDAVLTKWWRLTVVVMVLEVFFLGGNRV